MDNGVLTPIGGLDPGKGTPLGRTLQRGNCFNRLYGRGVLRACIDARKNGLRLMGGGIAASDTAIRLYLVEASTGESTFLNLTDDS